MRHAAAATGASLLVMFNWLRNWLTKSGERERVRTKKLPFCQHVLSSVKLSLSLEVEEIVSDSRWRIVEREERTMKKLATIFN